jgi:hypothetical protein
MTIRAFVAAGALAVAAVAAPVVAMSTAGQAVAGPPKCLAHIGNADDNVCAGYSNGQPIVGSTGGGIWGPNYQGGGLTSGNLMPGQTWTTPIG